MSTPTVTAPVRVCPHCQAQSQTLEKRCPNCKKKYKKHTVRNVLLGLIALGILAFAGCTALVGSAVNEAGKALDADQKAHAISQAQFDGIKIGATKAQVTAAAAPATPSDAQEFENKGVLDAKNVKSSCSYYNKAGGTFGDIFQLCFDADKVSSKNSY